MNGHGGSNDGTRIHMVSMEGTDKQNGHSRDMEQMPVSRETSLGVE